MRPASVGVPSASAIVGSLRALLHAMPFSVEGALVYGSVAKDRHHSGSDLDAMFFVENLPSPYQMTTFIAAFEALEHDLGLQPDPKYPIEVFDLAACRRMLGIAAPAAPAGRCVPEDAWELLYALVTPHLVVTGEDVVSGLRGAAEDCRLQLAHWASNHNS